MPARKRAWSSARSTRTDGLPSLRHRHVHSNSRPSSRSRDEVEVAADRLRPLAHRLKAEPRPPGPVKKECVEAATVVDDLDTARLLVRLDDHLDMGGAGVLADVAERLLDDPDELDFRCAGG